jgi:hypothetical protein
MNRNWTQTAWLKRKPLSSILSTDDTLEFFASRTHNLKFLDDETWILNLRDFHRKIKCGVLVIWIFNFTLIKKAAIKIFCFNLQTFYISCLCPRLLPLYSFMEEIPYITDICSVIKESMFCRKLFGVTADCFIMSHINIYKVAEAKSYVEFVAIQ